MDQLDQVVVGGRVRTADGASIGGAAVTLADLSGRQVAVEDGELARRDVELPASGRVAGTVLTTDGDRPFAGAQLSLVNEAGAEVATAAADTGGQFVFGDVPSGRYTLVASGYRPGLATLPAASTRARQADITLARPE